MNVNFIKLESHSEINENSKGFAALFAISRYHNPAFPYSLNQGVSSLALYAVVISINSPVSVFLIVLFLISVRYFSNISFTYPALLYHFLSSFRLFSKIFSDVILYKSSPVFFISRENSVPG
ncbi:TPA: hypothetical protein DEP21_06295 [Patescibacteria group bacterium]|nr:hypothetical protein [Candidatus Gracilibacteria bacterium]